MTDFSYIEFLCEIDFLKTLPAEALNSIADECRLKNLENDEVLFEDGEEGSSMFIILSGELVVWKHETEIARRGAGEYLGEMALIESKSRSAKVVASGDSCLLEINQQLFHSQLAPYPDALLAIMKTLSNRARETLKIFV